MPCHARAHHICCALPFWRSFHVAWLLSFKRIFPPPHTTALTSSRDTAVMSCHVMSCSHAHMLSLSDQACASVLSCPVLVLVSPLELVSLLLHPSPSLPPHHPVDSRDAHELRSPYRSPSTRLLPSCLSPHSPICHSMQQPWAQL